MKVEDTVREYAEQVIAKMAEGGAMAVLLPDVEINVYQAANGHWHSDVLLDPETWPRHRLPKRGNRPLISSADGGRHWYDTSAFDEATLDVLLTELLVELATLRLTKQIKKLVRSVSHRHAYVA